jgi:hypothetical protein
MNLLRRIDVWRKARRFRLHREWLKRCRVIQLQR